MLRQIIEDRRFALVDLALVLLGGAVGMIKPEAGFWFLPIALFPWLIRLFAGSPPFRRTSFDILIFVFLLTAGMGYFAAYDHVAAFEKFLFILISALLYYALSGQPEENFAPVIVLWFLIGVCLSLYYFLTHNFMNNPASTILFNAIGLRFLEARPGLGWPPIPSGYAAGLAVMMVTFMAYRLANPVAPPGRILKFITMGGLGVVFVTLLAAQSASIWASLLGSAGVWVVWRLFTQTGWSRRRGSLFPWVILVYLILVIAFIYTFGPAASASPSDFGTNTRLEVLMRSTYFLADFPLSGSGLASFPGLYSHYMLGIPYFYFSNSYNVFLDVAIEQGLLGGLVFLLIYLTGIFQVSQKVAGPNPAIQHWLALFALLFSLLHGLMQNYLYNAAGTLLLFFPAAMSVMLGHDNADIGRVSARIPAVPRIGKRQQAMILLGLMLIGGIFGYNRLASILYSNLGAVQLAQVELAGFPNSGWPGIGILPKLKEAESSLQTSLRFDPGNQTANHRLGLISMLHRDFESASRYLQTALVQAPNHRGIKKSLGYSYLWMGDLDKAQEYLVEFPETSGELDAYYWWWSDQDRVDLSNHAFQFLKILHSTQSQP